MNMPKALASVSAVIPTYNGRKLLEENLPAVLIALSSGSEVIIVDDASTDDTIEWLVKKFALKTGQPPKSSADFKLWQGQWHKQDKKLTLKVVQNQHNLRFGGNCNRGVSLAQHDWILLLNNDVSPFPDLLVNLQPYLTDPTLFAVGCLEIEGSEKVLGGKNKLWFERGLFVHSRADQYTTGETAWVSGGSGLFNRSKWLELGGFDREYYPAYWEDVDLSFRARQRGWQVWFAAEAKVHHNHETTNTTVFGQRNIEVMSLRNAQRFVWKNGSWWQKCQYLFWLPYHLLITNARTQGVFAESYQQAWKRSSSL